MGLGSRSASRHETAASTKVAGVDPQEYWAFKPGTPVMTVDGLPGTVTAVLDGPVAGNEAYEVSLDKGMGGGVYTASQLSPAGTTTASVEHTAADDYPELGTILIERPDPAINTVLASKTAINDAEMSQASSEREHYDPDSHECQFCEGEANSARGGGEPLKDTEWGPMHPSCEEEWKHGVGVDYDHDIDEFKADREDERRERREDPYYERPSRDEELDPYGRSEDAMERYRTYSREPRPFAHEADHGFHEDLQRAPGEDYQHGHGMYDGKPYTFDPGLGCPHCTDGFMTEDARTRHIREQHPGEYSGPTDDLMMAKDRINEIRGQASLDPYALVREAANDSDFRFEFTASWSDVRAKAQRIRAEGGVRILSAQKAGVVGEVKGEHHIYETGLQYVPGARKIATWQCGCKWAAYAWGRSPRYKRFEGRMCSHALALQFEAQSRGMFGRDVKEDSHRLPGQHQRTPVVVEFDKGTDKNITRRSVPPGNMRSVWSKVIEPAPAITAVAQMIGSGDDADEIGLLLIASRIESSGLVALAKTAAVNDAWGEPAAPENVWPSLPGATKPRDPQENPASAGPLAGPDPGSWHDIAPMTMGDRVASIHDEGEPGETDFCGNCGLTVRRTSDDNVPWVHVGTGNSYCDVEYPEHAVERAGQEGRTEAAPVVHEPPSTRYASMNDEDTALWDDGGENLEGAGAVADLHDEPEGALPSTDGGAFTNTEGLLGDQSDQMHATYDDALSPESESIQTVGSMQDDPSVAAIVAEFQRTAGAKVIMTDSRPSSGGPSDGDIAAAARAHLEGKTAMRAFSPEEQRALINEPGRAGNADMLDIGDTHYAALDAIRGEDDDEEWLG